MFDSDWYVAWAAKVCHESLLDTPKAPSNYKDPQKIEEFIQAAKQRQLRTAAFVPYVSSLVAIRICTAAHGDIVFSAEHAPDLDPLHVAQEAVPIFASLREYQQRNGGASPRLIGWDIDVFLSILAADVSRLNTVAVATHKAVSPISPMSLIAMQRCAIDPYDVMVQPRAEHACVSRDAFRRAIGAEPLQGDDLPLVTLMHCQLVSIEQAMEVLA